jgi:hypothetical protein
MIRWGSCGALFEEANRAYSGGTVGVVEVTVAGRAWVDFVRESCLLFLRRKPAIVRVWNARPPFG